MTAVENAQQAIQENLPDIKRELNAALRGGEALTNLRPCIERLGRGGVLPHWYEQLESDGTLPNLDGKSLGSVLEMVFVAVLEIQFLSESPLIPFKINPAKGVDIPALELGVKSPSTNYCTSEPFFSAYERLLGNEHDAIILLTDYQDAKKNPPLKMQIIDAAYLSGSQIADKNLCSVAKTYRERLLEEDSTELKKILRFLAYINQSDWEAKELLKLVKGPLEDESINARIDESLSKFDQDNAKYLREGKEQIPLESKERLERIRTVQPHWLGLVNALDNWVIEEQKDFGRYPNETEWQRFLSSPLDGMIGMSLALQWRYNFGQVFRD